MTNINSSINRSINNSSTVTLHFSIAMESGDLVDSTFDKKMATFTMGDGNLLAGFERPLVGLSVGAKETFIISPEDAFGMPNPSNIQSFKRTQFAQDLELVSGAVISFADAKNGELPGVIKSVDEEQVEVDFNHPLSGQTLSFCVEIHAVDNDSVGK